MDGVEPLHDARQDSVRPNINILGGQVGAIGDHNNVNMTPRRVLNWPVVVGSVPAVASAFQPRTAILEKMLRAENTVVLQHASGQILSGTGGVGKTQIAAHLFATSEADLQVWANAESREAVITGFAEASIRLDLADPDVDPERLARLFLGYLKSTGQSWLVVLDNADAGPDLAELWPPAGGQVIVTTRRRDAGFSGSSRTLIDVGVFTEEEARNYLHERLGPLLHSLPQDVLAESSELAVDLGWLPLALAQAAAVIIDQGITCAEYRAWFANHALALEELFPVEADADGYARTVATTWQLAVMAADRIEPTGLARHMAALVAMLDPAGAPELVLTSEAACANLSAATSTQVAASTARKALRALNRLSLINHDPNPDNPRGVRMHNLTGRAIRQTLSPGEAESCGRSVADGLYQVWPAIELDALLAESLRSNTTAVAGLAPAGLWDRDARGGHAALFRTGRSLTEAGLIGPAIEYHRQLQDQAAYRLGPDHPDTLASHNRLASAYQWAGKLNQAIPLFEQTLTDRERVLGPDHPDTLGSRNNLASAYMSAGILDQAIPLFEQTLTDAERILGPDHPNALASRNNLASAYQSAGKLDQAITLFEQTLADSQRVLGPDHPQTLGSRHDVASAYMSAGKLNRAITLFEQALTDDVRVLGPDHPDTLGSRNNLAAAYQRAGKLDQAIPLFEQAVADRERVLGPDHPNTLGSRNNLAYTYQSAGRLDQAIPLFEQVLTDDVRVLGPDHPNTLGSRNNLAYTYMSAGKLDRAITLFEQAAIDQMRVQGPDHPNTLGSRNNLASAYESAGRLDQAIPLFEQTLTDSQRILGPNHPQTLGSRNNLASAYMSAGRLDQAIPLFEQTLTDRERLLDPDHPDTLDSRNNLASAYMSAGRLDQAIPLFEQTLTDRERLLDPDHPDTLDSRNNLASAYQAAGKPDQAIP